jgi:hypothetical protein
LYLPAQAAKAALPRTISICEPGAAHETHLDVERLRGARIVLAHR